LDRAAHVLAHALELVGVGRLIDPNTQAVRSRALVEVQRPNARPRLKLPTHLRCVPWHLDSQRLRSTIGELLTCNGRQLIEGSSFFSSPCLPRPP
jgi:hypothetical protein